MKNKWIYLSLAFAFLTGTRADSQTIISNFLIGARNVALGSADMAEPHDMTSMYENPATIALLAEPSLVLNHVQGLDNEMQEDLAFPVVYSDAQMLAFGAEYYSLGELSTSKDATRYAVGYDVAFASKINERMSVGGSVSFRRGYVPHLTNATAASYALGFDYAPSADMSYGLSLTGLGTGVQFETANTIVTPVQSVLPRALSVSAVMKFPTETSLQPAYLTIALGSQKVFGVTGVNFMGGVEFYPVRFLALRFGYSAGPSGTLQRYGLGLREGIFHIDAAVYPVKNGSSRILFEQLSVGVNL